MPADLYKPKRDSRPIRNEAETGDASVYFLFSKNEPSEEDEEDKRMDPQTQSNLIDRYASSRSTQSVAERMPDEYAVGVFSPEGMDSSIIASAVARQSRSYRRPFSDHFGKADPNDSTLPRAVADRNSAAIIEEVLIRPRNFCAGDWHQMIWHLDEPIGDPITQPNLNSPPRPPAMDRSCSTVGGR